MQPAFPFRADCLAAQYLQKPRVRTAVRSTPLHAMQSRNDQVKLLLLKLRLCRAVLLLSGANQRKNT